MCWPSVPRQGGSVSRPLASTTYGWVEVPSPTENPFFDDLRIIQSPDFPVPATHRHGEGTAADRGAVANMSYGQNPEMAGLVTILWPNLHGLTDFQKAPGSPQFSESQGQPCMLQQVPHGTLRRSNSIFVCSREGSRKGAGPFWVESTKRCPAKARLFVGDGVPSGWLRMA